jgi:predicted transcriptional regulator of viral defense system
MVRGSYVSLQSALAYYGLIPEYVAVTTSVTTARPGRWETPLGDYAFRHIKAGLFYGYRRIKLGGGQHAFVASPEKGLLDLVYLQPGGDATSYLQALRLGNLERLDLDELGRLAELAHSPKLQRATALIVEMVRAEEIAYETL